MNKLVKPCQSRKSLQVSLLNAYSINNKACHIYDLIVDSKMDVMFLTETWHLSDVSPAFKAATPLTHESNHIVRPGAVSGHPGHVLGVNVRRHILNVKFSCRTFNTFEYMDLQFKCASDKIVAYLVYQPAGHITNYFSVDFESLLIEHR